MTTHTGQSSLYQQPIENEEAESALTALQVTLPEGWLLPLVDFTLLPQNQKGSDLSHVGDLSDILRGQFVEEKQTKKQTDKQTIMVVSPYPGLGVSRQSR